MDLVGRVHGHEHRADLGRRPEGDVPGGHVRRPDGHLGPGPDAHRDERSREVVHVVPELLVGAGVVQRRIFECVLVGELLDDAVQDLREGQVDQLILLPDVFAGAVVVEVAGALLPAGVLVPVHVVHKIGENDLQILQILHPAALPLEGDVAVVVDAAERAHDVVDRHVALTDQVVGVPVVRVAHVYVAHVGAEVADRVGGLLVLVPVRMVHVPEDRQLVAGVAVHQAPEARRVGVDAGGLDQDRDPGLLRVRKERVQAVPHQDLVLALRLDADVGNGHVLRDVHQGAHRGEALLPAVRVGPLIAGPAVLHAEVDGGVEDRDLQSVLAQCPRRRLCVVFVEGGAASDQLLRLVQVVDLDPCKAHIRGDLLQLFPADFIPSSV